MSGKGLQKFLAPAALAIVLTGCGGKRPNGTAADSGIEKTFERGPVTVIVKIDKKDPTIADRINLTLEVTAAEDYEITLPSFGDKLEQFGIVDYSTSQPELIGGKRTRQTRSYVLEPFLSGDYTIPPMKFGFHRKGESEHELETEAIALKVSSLLPEAAAKKLQIHDITGPVPMPHPLPVAIWWTVGAVALFGIVATTAWWLRRRFRASVRIAPKRPAHEIAFDELEDLIARRLPEAGELKLFYQHISGILRRYIENRFGIHAPGQTTEEFLANQRDGTVLDPPHQQLLGKFLHHCDLVKFAEYQPTNEDVQAAFDACRDFIFQTREQNVPGPATTMTTPAAA
jgi:hypothetical protein